jgi:hypothetical protein
MTSKISARFTAGWIAGLASALAVALVLGLWAGLAFTSHKPSVVRPIEGAPQTGALVVFASSTCPIPTSGARPLTVTVHELYALGSGVRPAIPYTQRLRARWSSGTFEFHVPFGMYRVQTSAGRSAIRYALPGVVNRFSLTPDACKSYAPSLRGV